LVIFDLANVKGQTAKTVATLNTQLLYATVKKNSQQRFFKNGRRAHERENLFELLPFYVPNCLMQLISIGGNRREEKKNHLLV
jgi:hypothetical protein